MIVGGDLTRDGFCEGGGIFGLSAMDVAYRIIRAIKNA